MELGIKSYKHIVTGLVLYIATIALYIWFVKSPLFAQFSGWSQKNFILLFCVLVLIKIVGIVWPPLSGGLFTLGSIPVIGWMNAYWADLLGNALGSTVAYFLGRTYGYRLLEKIFDDVMIEKVKNFKIKEHREIECVIGLRVLGGGALVEIVCYAAGLLNIKFKNFLIGVFLSHIIVVLPFYYFIGSLWGGKNIVFNLIFAAIAVPFFLKFKKRYME